MLNRRAAKFVAVGFVSVLAGTLLSSASYSAPQAADECLAAPNGPSPEGSHWYYRLERGTKRHCWYLRDESQKSSQSASSSVAPSTKPAAPKAEPAIRGMVANARAELPPASTRGIAGSTASIAPPQPPALVPNATSAASSRPAPDTSSTPTVASRWPGPSSLAPSANQTQAAADADDADMQPTSSVAAAAEPPPVVLATADTPAEKPQGHSGSIPMLSIVMVGALSLAGLVGSLIMRFGGRRRREVDLGHEAMWDTVGTEPQPSHAIEPRPSRQAQPAPARTPRRPGFTLPREMPATNPAADRQDDRIAEMLTRLARSAAR